MKVASVVTGVSIVDIRLLPFSTSDFFVTVSYQLNAFITNTYQSAMNPVFPHILARNSLKFS